MKLVFVCSPLRGDYKKNIQNVQKYCKYIIHNYKDIIPIAPHLYFTQFLDDKIEDERNIGIKCGMDLLKKCTDIYVFVDHTFILTEGMKKEVDLAISLNIPVHYIQKEYINV